MGVIEFNKRQQEIIEIVKTKEPITSTDIAQLLHVTRAALRADLSILTLSGILIAKPKVGYFYNDSLPEETLGRKLKELLVGDVKSIPVVVDEKTTIYDAMVALFLDDASTVFVHSDGCLAGLVSRKDFLKAAIGGKDFQKAPIAIIMTRMPNIVVAYPNESVLEAAKRLVNHQIDCLPVVEKFQHNGSEGFKIVGSISKTNITQLFAEMGK